jgi:hypothetical protein
MTTPATLSQSRATLSDRSAGVYDHASQQRMADPRDPNRDPGPFPGKGPNPTSDGEAW